MTEASQWQRLASVNYSGKVRGSFVKSMFKVSQQQEHECRQFVFRAQELGAEQKKVQGRQETLGVCSLLDRAEIMGKKLHMAPLYGVSCVEKDNLL